MSSETETSEQTSENTQKLKGLDWWIHEAKETGMTVAIFLPIWLIFTTLVFELRSIPSESMVPQLQVGDRVVVSKFAYGYDRYSPAFGIGTWFTKEDKSDPNQRMFASEPKRGDVIVFRHPNDNKVMIKRLIGLPGDSVQMINGVLYLNGEKVKREFVRHMRYVPSGDRFARDAIEYRETLPNGISYLIHEFASDGKYDRADGAYDQTPLFEVPEGHVFMMGDNRDNSEDSRAPYGHIDLYKQQPNAWGRTGFPIGNEPTTIGYVPMDYLMGRAETVLFTLYKCRRSGDSECAAPRMWKKLHK